MPVRFSPAIRAACLLAAFAVVAVIIYESTQERGSPGILDLSTNEAYVAHFAIYGAFAFCALGALAPRSYAGLFVLLALAAALGIALELYQAQLTTRSASTTDALADIAGAASGFLAYFILATLLEPPEQTQPTKS